VRLSRKTTKRICANFSGFRRKHLFITTCIEKHCIRPLINYLQFFFRTEIFMKRDSAVACCRNNAFSYTYNHIMLGFCSFLRAVQCGHFVDKGGFYMRMPALFGAKKLWIFRNLWCVYIVRISFMNGLLARTKVDTNSHNFSHSY